MGHGRSRRGDAGGPRYEPGVDMCGLALLAGTANVVMQLAWAPVGYGVVESTVASGQIFRHPLKRTRTTLTYLAVALIGTDEDRRHFATAVNAVHARVRSTPSSPVAYRASDPDLQLWVAACLFVGLEDVHRRIRGAVGAAEADALYQHAAVLGTTLQMPRRQWPADRAAFQRYWETGLSRIGIDDTVRRHLDDVVMLRFLPRPLSALLGPPNRFVTVGFLPERFRQEMGYAWSAADQSRFDGIMSRLFAGSRRLPAAVRRFPFNALLWGMRRRVRSGRTLV